MSPMTKASLWIHLTTINTLVLIFLRLSAANHGVNFIVSLPSSDNPDASMYVYVTPYNTDSKVSLTWTLPNSPDQQGQATIKGSSVQTVQFNLSSKPSAIYISASHPVVVVVTVVFANQNVYSMGTYLASPAEELSRTYTVITHCGHESCNLVVANAYDKVRLTVTLMLTPKNANITYSGKRYYNGSVIQLTLWDLEAVQINSGAVDLSGSVVTSSRPTQVVSGCGLVLTSTTNHNIMIEQMPSQSNIGTKFILLNTVSKSNVLTTVKVAFIQQNTNVSFKGSSLMLLLNTSGWITYLFSRSEPLIVLLTDKPVIVEILYEVVTQGEVNSLASVVVTPVDNWASKYVTLMSVGSISLVTTDSCMSNILLNKNIVGSKEWTQAGNNPQYYYATITMTTYNIVQAVMEGQMGCTFGGYVMYENGDGYTAFPLGWKQFELESSISLFSSSTETVKPSAITYLPSESKSMDIIVHSSQPLHPSALDVEVADTAKTLAMVTSTVPLPSYFITSEDVLYSRPSVFVEQVADAVSTDFTNSHTASLFLASTSNMKESSDVSQRSTVATSNSNTKSTKSQHCGNECDPNFNNSKPFTQFPVTSSSQWNANINPHNVSDIPSNSVKPTNSTWIEFASMFNASKVSTVSSQLLKDETSSTSFLQLITASTDIPFENLGSSVQHMNTKVSIDIILNEIFTPSSVLFSEWIAISKTTQFTMENSLATKMTTRMSSNILTTISFKDTSTNIESYYDTKTTEIFTNDHANGTFNFTISNTTSECPCRCTSKFYLSLVVNATTLPMIVIDTEKDLLLDKKSLIAYRMGKLSLHNRQQSAKYIGSTLGILVVVSIVGFLFSNDILRLCCKKSYST